MRNFNRIMSVTLAILLAITMFGSEISEANETAVNLGTADSFALLAGSTITNTGTTIINGDIGLHPGTEFSGQDTATVNGEIHIADAVALQAKNDLLVAYNNAAGRTGDTIGSELGGRTLTPGVYGSDTSLQITGTLTLDGQNNPNAVFILQAGSTLTTASGSNVELINGANSNNVFWQVGSSATLGTNSDFVGNILSSESITATTGADIQGQLLALNGAITLDNNTITNETFGSLTVTKVVTGDTGDMTLPEFELTVTGPDGFSETRTFDHNESYTWENLVPGEYNVTESRTGLNSEWTVTGEGPVQVEANQQQEATITNAYSPIDDSTPIEPTPTSSSLTVTKVVTGDVGDMTLPEFKLTVTGPDNFSETRTFVKDVPYTWGNLVPGEYTITEDQTGLSSEWAFSGDRTIQVEANQEHEATVTNVYSPADDSTPTETPVDSITDTDDVTGNTSDDSDDSNDSDTVDTSDNGDETLPELEPTVTESEEFSETETLTTYEKGEEIPQTGQNTDYSLGILLGIIAAMFAGAGIILAHKRKKLNA